MRTIATLVLTCIVMGAFTADIAFAASNGTITPPDQYAWNDEGGYVNWDATGGNVIVSDTALTGYIWSAGFGWINLSPSMGGVTNNAGTLGGYAWSENTGWIDFTGVTIDSNGLFHGHTTAQSTFGTMTFDCTYCKVVTSWLGSSITTYVPPTTTSDLGSNGMPAQSGPLSYGYQVGATTSRKQSTTVHSTSSATAIPVSLTPTSPPPHVQPKTAPIKSPRRAISKTTAAYLSTMKPATTTSATTALPIPPPTPSSAYIHDSTLPAPTATPQTPAPSCSIFTCWLQNLLNFIRSIF